MSRATTCPQCWWRSLPLCWTRRYKHTPTHTPARRADPPPPHGAAHLLSVCQDDDDGHLLALQIIRDLVDKGGDVFLDQLARLGVINKVSTLAGPASDDENEDESKPEKVKTINDQAFLSGCFWVKGFVSCSTGSGASVWELWLLSSPLNMPLMCSGDPNVVYSAFSLPVSQYMKISYKKSGYWV